MQAYWTNRAAEVVAADPDAATDPWRELYRRYLAEVTPQRVAALTATGELEPFLTVQVAEARSLEEALFASMDGIPQASMLAESLAMTELMPKAGGDEDRPMPEDLDEANAAMADAAEKFLAMPLSPNPSPK